MFSFSTINDTIHVHFPEWNLAHLLYKNRIPKSNCDNSLGILHIPTMNFWKSQGDCKICYPGNKQSGHINLKDVKNH